MGVIIDTDLRYLARVTGDGYYASRAADSAAWMLQCLELYPAATGYGRYGILSERWCPSDGLDVERFSDGVQQLVQPQSVGFRLRAGSCM